MRETSKARAARPRDVGRFPRGSTLRRNNAENNIGWVAWVDRREYKAQLTTTQCIARAECSSEV